MLSFVKSRSSPRMHTLMALTALLTSGLRQKMFSLESRKFGPVHDAEAAPGQVADEGVLGFFLQVAVPVRAVLGLQRVLGHHPELLLFGDFGVAVLGALHRERVHQAFRGGSVGDVGLVGLALVPYDAVVHHELAVVFVEPGLPEFQDSLVVAFVDPDNSAHGPVPS